MRIIIIILTMLISANGIAYSQEARSLSDSLYVLLGSKKVFEARDFYEKHRDSLQQNKATPLIYASQMNIYLNKPDSAIKSVRQLLDEFDFSDNSTRLYYLNMLATLYVEKEDYKRLIKIFDEIEELLHISEMPEEQKTGLLKELLNQRKLAVYHDSLPKKEVIDTSKSGRTSVLFTVNPILGCMAYFNGIPLNTWIDTGSQFYLILKKEVANKCHLKDLYSEIDTIRLNDIPMPMSIATIDSIQIGTFIFKNIPAMVLHQDSYSVNTDYRLKAEIDSVFALQDVVIGLRMLLMLKSIELDLEKSQICLSLQKKTDIETANMYLNNAMILTNLSINQICFTGMIDTGAKSGVIIGKSFYEKYNNNLPTNTDIEEYTKVFKTFGNSMKQKIRVLSIPHVNIGAERILMQEQDVCASLEEDIVDIDGIIGYDFLKKLSPKVKLDFENMTISIIKERR